LYSPQAAQYSVDFSESSNKKQARDFCALCVEELNNKKVLDVKLNSKAVFNI